jgi:hypothetical protein
MYLSATGLAQLLKEHVVELRFKRRNKKEGFNEKRRMLCTNDALLLNSEAGKKILNFKLPTEQRKYNPLSKNLVLTFDIFMQNYRMISIEQCDVVAVISTRPPDKWWLYFDKKVRSLTAAEKLLFINN